MKRDWAVIRAILVETESLRIGQTVIVRSDEDEVRSEHYRLLVEQGSIQGDIKVYLGGELKVIAYRLTWDGHELLDSIKNENVWSQVTERLKSVGDGATVEIVKSLAVMFLKKALQIGDA